MKPLSAQLRPKTFDEIIGQDHLVGPHGPIRKMVQNQKLFSLILYGNPGIGKTTIAEVICLEYNQPYFTFNASVDNKQKLTEILEHSKLYTIILIIDEIHRMRKDIQDVLLPYVENGQVIIIGMTTVNPYHSVNPAIRSRVVIYKLNDLNKNDIKQALNRAYNKHYSHKKIDQEVFDYITNLAARDIRMALNSFEVIMNVNEQVDQITLDLAKQTILSPSISIDKDSDLYFETLSGLQKSIRGSDVDASLHYLAILLAADDLLSLTRRLLVIAYEDIGLANPEMGPRTKAACDTALTLGMPEAMIPLGNVVIDMALGPKSNTAYLAVSKAVDNVNQGNSGNLPPHLKNTYSFDNNSSPYLYPHDYPGAWVNQEYMPKELKGTKYYEPKDSSSYENYLKSRYEAILKARNKDK